MTTRNPRIRWFLALLIGTTLGGDGRSQQAPLDPDSMFRQLDVDGDGKLTVAEGGPGAQQFVRRLLEMSDKRPDQALDRAEFERLVERHRRGAAADRRTTGGRPTSERLPESRAVERSDEAERAPAARRSPTSQARPSAPPAPSRSDSSLAGRLAGVWRGWVVDGRGENPNTGHMEMELRVEGNRMTGREIGTSRAPGGLGDGTFTVAAGADANSGTLDAVATTGQHRGRAYPGIFQLDGPTLRWCVNNRSTARPTDFETGRGNYFLILQKQP